MAQWGSKLPSPGQELKQLRMNHVFLGTNERLSVPLFLLTEKPLCFSHNILNKLPLRGTKLKDVWGVFLGLLREQEGGHHSHKLNKVTLCSSFGELEIPNTNDEDCEERMVVADMTIPEFTTHVNGELTLGNPRGMKLIFYIECSTVGEQPLLVTAFV
eukprot:TRINITY_DN702_c0_g1_i4.p1 TRINITY_DN702_c0_g1~~TRINITY_DN702_c0_g1_i4.p1  ORF type:complete len:158 (-),score=19.78 TRINITY_DN702_c0_g1_i4:77-550(-)